MHVIIMCMQRFKVNQMFGNARYNGLCKDSRLIKYRKVCVILVYAKLHGQPSVWKCTL